MLLGAGRDRTKKEEKGKERKRRALGKGEILDNNTEEAEKETSTTCIKIKARKGENLLRVEGEG